MAWLGAKNKLQNTVTQTHASYGVCRGHDFLWYLNKKREVGILKSLHREAFGATPPITISPGRRYRVYYMAMLVNNALNIFSHVLYFL